MFVASAGFFIAPIATLSGALTMTGGSVAGNSGQGIRLESGIASTINGVTITNNTSPTSGGGGVYVGDTTVNLANCLIAGNTALRGAGIWGANDSNVTIVNSTISGNSSTGVAGGVELDGSIAVLTNVTVTNNRADSDNSGGETGGGIQCLQSPVLRNTIVAKNIRGTLSTADDISVTTTLDQMNSVNNLIGAGWSGGLVNGINQNQVGVANPGLGPLGSNGGPTQTHALLPGSPAIDAGNNCVLSNSCSPDLRSALTADQRGFNRSMDGNGDGTATVDVGAYEVQSFLVTNTADSGAGSLRQAIGDANASPGTKVINFQSGLTGTIDLLSALPPLSTSMAINGPGANLLTVQRSMAVGTVDPVFTATTGTNVTISGLTISHGVHGIFNDRGTVTVNSCVISGNEIAGITNGQNKSGTLIVNNSTISNNNGYGINNLAGTGNTTIVTVNNSTISGNTIVGIFNSAAGGNAPVTVNNSTLSGNGGDNSSAGGVGNSADQSGTATVAINNSTLSGNVTCDQPDCAAGMRNSAVNSGSTAIAVITNSTIFGNSPSGSSSVGGVRNAPVLGGTATVVLRNTIVAGNFHNSGASASDISGVIDSSSSFNLIGTGGAGGLINGTNNNQVGVINAGLGALANNGGPTMSHALLPGSPAINAGSNANLPADILDLDGDRNTTEPVPFDQRGLARVTNTNVDIGAFESRGFNIAATGGTPQSATISTAFSSPLVATVSSPFGEPVAGGVITFAAPASGASGTFPGGLISTSAALNGSGLATSPVFTANSISGGYSVTGGSNGISSAASFALTNLKINQTITFGALGDKTFGGPDFPVTATGSSALALTFTASGNCTMMPGNNVHLTSGGSCTITASQSGDASYNAAPDVARTFNINKANQAVTFGALPDKTFGDADFPVTATSSSGLAVVFTPSGNCTMMPGNNVHLGAVGSCTITASQSGDASYNAAPAVARTFNINKANQTIAFNSLANKSFGDADFTVSATASSNLPVNFAASGACSVSSGSVHLTGAGSCTITASQPGNGNFNPAADVPQTFNIADFISINDVSTTEGDSGTKTINFTVTLAAASNQTVTVSYATADGSAVAPSDYLSINATTLTFNPGDTTKTIGVTINGDQSFESDETFVVNLTSPTNAVISDSQAQGTILNDDAQGGNFSFSQANYAVSESVGLLVVTVNRSGDTSAPATVDYGTSDAGASSLPCSNTGGLASARCDFTTAMGTLTFGAGVTQKTFTVLVNGDSFSEGPESFTVNLTNQTGGAVLSTPSSAIVTIADDSSGLPPNAIDAAQFFVRQQYHDFLNREPDTSGLNFWTNEITSCGTDQACIEAKRINVSAAFFLSIEFQDTGYLVERINKVSYGSTNGISTFGGAHQFPVPIIRFIEFLPDTQEIGQGVVVGQGNWQQQLDANKAAFTAEFVQRTRFTTSFPNTMTPAQFVDTLNTNAGMPLSQSERDQLVSDLTTSTKTRAQVLRAVAEDPDLNSAESNRAFVLMQFFGYLRRNPNDAPDSDYTGYDFWLTKLNQFNGNFVNADMVKAFINSSEYRQRFGP
jgi:hypothetical protein